MKARAWTTADPLEPSAKGYRPWGPRCYEDDDDAPSQRDWWNNIDVISLNDPKALGHFLDNCDHLLEATDFGGESGASIPWYSRH
jgi:hypothetical protein